MHNTTKRITEGAMMTAIFGVMLFLNRQLGGILEYLMYWIFTFPILLYTAKYGIRASLATSTAMVVLSFMLGTPTTIFYAVSCVLIGVVYGGGVRKGWSNTSLLASTGILTLLSYIFTMVVFAAFFGYSVEEDIEMLTMLMNMLNMNFGVSMKYILCIFTSFTVILTTVLQTMCIHLVAVLFMERLKIAHHKMKTVFDLRVPKWIGWICIVIWLLFYGSNMVELKEGVRSVLMFLYIMMKVFCVGYGSLTFLSFILLMRKRWLLFVLAIVWFVPLGQSIIAVTGIIDMLQGIRKRIKESVIHE